MFWFRRHRSLLKVQSDTSSDCEVVQTVETWCLKKDKQFILRTQHKMGLSLETLLGPTPQFRRWRLQAEVMCTLFGAPVLETQVLKFGDNMDWKTLSVLVLLYRVLYGFVTYFSVFVSSNVMSGQSAWPGKSYTWKTQTSDLVGSKSAVWSCWCLYVYQQKWWNDVLCRTHLNTDEFSLGLASITFLWGLGTTHLVKNQGYDTFQCAKPFWYFFAH